jgi:hypothetical protein
MDVDAQAAVIILAHLLPYRPRVGPGRGIRFIIYLVNAKQVIRVLNHALGAYRQ